MANNKRIWITTEDNPWCPFTQWNKWCKFDGLEMGYNTLGKLDKEALWSENNLTPFENDWRTEVAIIKLIERGVAVGRNGVTSNYILAVEGQTTPF